MPEDSRENRVTKFVATAAAATIAFVAGPWGDLMPAPYGVLIFCACVAAVIYVYLISPRHSFFRASSDVSAKDRRYVASGLLLITAAIFSGMGIFVWLEFPREMTVLEKLQSYYVECRQLERRAKNTEEEDFQALNDDFVEWWMATKHFVAREMPPPAESKLQAPSDSIRGVIRPSGSGPRLANVIGSGCVNLESLIENDEWQ